MSSLSPQQLWLLPPSGECGGALGPTTLSWKVSRLTAIWSWGTYISSITGCHNLGLGHFSWEGGREVYIQLVWACVCFIPNVYLGLFVNLHPCNRWPQFRASVRALRMGPPTCERLGVPTFCLQFSANVISLCLGYSLSKNRPILGVFIARLNMLMPINSQISEWPGDIIFRDNCARLQFNNTFMLSDSLPYQKHQVGSKQGGRGIWIEKMAQWGCLVSIYSQGCFSV